MRDRSSQKEMVIEGGKKFGRYWSDLWLFRELFLFITWRDILVRYKQTAIGILWSVLRPLLTMVVFTFVFGRIAKMPTDGVTPYALMVFAGLLPWQMFANAVQESSNSFISNANMVSKIYFPRMILPISSVMTALIDLFISLILFIILELYYGVFPTWKIFALPIFIIMAMGLAIGVGLIISSLNVSYRDFRYVIPFIIQFGLYISPVGFSISAIPEKWKILYSLNPMVGIIEGFRWCLLGENISINWVMVHISIVIILVTLICGIAIFRNMERTFADKI